MEKKLSNLTYEELRKIQQEIRNEIFKREDEMLVKTCKNIIVGNIETNYKWLFEKTDNINDIVDKLPTGIVLYIKDLIKTINEGEK